MHMVWFPRLKIQGRFLGWSSIVALQNKPIAAPYNAYMRCSRAGYLDPLA